VSATVAIIPARGGSKGIPRKNLIELCGHPLVAWSILHARHARGVDAVYVSSDSDAILSVARRYGALPIERPAEISGDAASSESAWLHALDSIEARGVTVARILGLQATSPLREPSDLEGALAQYERDGLDSLFSVAEVEDFFTWRLDERGQPQAVNYDWRSRRPRQQIAKRYLENGSLFLFTPELLRRENNRMGGRMGLFVMARHKLFQIDSPDDLALAESIMRGYCLDRIAEGEPRAP
jgi:N-acylneuraminate cytidylyltransferase